MGTHLIFESDFDCLTDSFALSNVFQHRGKGVARGCHLQPRHGQLPDVFGAQAAEVGRRRKRDKRCARPAASTTSQQFVPTPMKMMTMSTCSVLILRTKRQCAIALPHWKRD